MLALRWRCILLAVTGKEHRHHPNDSADIGRQGVAVQAALPVLPFWEGHRAHRQENGLGDAMWCDNALRRQHGEGNAAL
jgi:hypothetical protein